MKLKKYRLADIGKVITGKTPSTSIAENYACGNIPFYTPEDVAKGLGMMGRNNRFISQTGFEEIASNTISGESVLVGCIGSDMGNVAYSNITCATNQQINSITQFKNGAEPLYVYYLLSTMKPYFQKIAGSTTTPILPKSVFEEIEIYLPGIKYQKDIVSILYALDRKIALNHQINDNLEAMAKQLYDYWFVQFDFPNEEDKPYKSSGGAMVWNEKLKRKIPNGWTVETVGTYANCKSGYAIKSSDFKAKGIPVIKIGNIQEDYTLNMNGCQYIENNTNKLFYVYQNDVVIAMTGATIGKFAIVPFSETGYFVNQRVGKFELGNNPIKKMPYLINSLKIDYFRNQIFQLASGCAQPNISVEQINNISLLYPSTKILREYNMKCKWMYEQIANCRYQIDVLTKLRDKLMPLLMNGQATVNYHLSDD